MGEKSSRKDWCSCDGGCREADKNQGELEDEAETDTKNLQHCGVSSPTELLLHDMEQQQQQQQRQSESEVSTSCIATKNLTNNTSTGPSSGTSVLIPIANTTKTTVAAVSESCRAAATGPGHANSTSSSSSSKNCCGGDATICSDFSVAPVLLLQHQKQQGTLQESARSSHVESASSDDSISTGSGPEGVIPGVSGFDRDGGVKSSSVGVALQGAAAAAAAAETAAAGAVGDATVGGAAVGGVVVGAVSPFEAHKSLYLDGSRDVRPAGNVEDSSIPFVAGETPRLSAACASGSAFAPTGDTTVAAASSVSADSVFIGSSTGRTSAGSVSAERVAAPTTVTASSGVTAVSSTAVTTTTAATTPPPPTKTGMTDQVVLQGNVDHDNDTNDDGDDASPQLAGEHDDWIDYSCATPWEYFINDVHNAIGALTNQGLNKSAAAENNGKSVAATHEEARGGHEDFYADAEGQKQKEVEYRGRSYVLRKLHRGNSHEVGGCKGCVDIFQHLLYPLLV